jgi:hypothetical protein
MAVRSGSDTGLKGIYPGEEGVPELVILVVGRTHWRHTIVRHRLMSANA